MIVCKIDGVCACDVIVVADVLLAGHTCGGWCALGTPCPHAPPVRAHVHIYELLSSIANSNASGGLTRPYTQEIVYCIWHTMY